MKVRHRRFVEEFCIDGDKTKAAIRAGYAVDCAKQTGYRLYNTAEIRFEIDKRLADLSMSAEEAIRHNSDIAKTRLNDFFIIKKVQGREMTEQYVTVLLEAVQDEIALIRDYMSENSIEADWAGPFLKRIEALQNLEIDYLTDIARYGRTVTRLAPGKPVVMEVAELDIVALAKAKDVGRIAEYSQNEQGTKIKMYAADKALELVMKLNGKLINKVDHTSGGKSFGDFLMESGDE